MLKITMFAQIIRSVLGENIPDMYKRKIISVILIQIHIFIKIIL